MRAAGLGYPAVRNLDRDGISQSVALAASIYRRYRSVNEADIKAALDRVQRGSQTRKVVALEAHREAVAV